jgi:hypothetical protein
MHHVAKSAAGENRLHGALTGKCACNLPSLSHRYKHIYIIVESNCGGGRAEDLGDSRLVVRDSLVAHV